MEVTLGWKVTTWKAEKTTEDIKKNVWEIGCAGEMWMVLTQNHTSARV